ncbi:RBBP9/YdeN family alpha/beta hydrolase [Komagataeibacter rhaeticus]|uniref:RBBP9/YdeN family alpha/beta hydrolase n=1 Tax=Komagataeibacter rhaeticus TaxID=215221 RepID=UPI0039E8B38D
MPFPSAPMAPYPHAGDLPSHPPFRPVAGPPDCARAVRRLVHALAGFDVLIVPGLDGSLPHHWQSRWAHILRQNGLGVHRVRQRDWARPTYRMWAQTMRRTLGQARDRPVIIVAHSLGAALSVRMAAARELENVAGAFLVALADVAPYRGADRHRVAEFAALPTGRLPIPAMMVAGHDDAWLSLPRARSLSHAWGATLRDAGRVGHIGNQSAIGPWPDGMDMLADFATSLPADHEDSLETV